MIKLCIEDYCQNCPEFEAKVETLRIESGFEFKYSTVITCEHSNKCENIAAYLTGGKQC